MDKSQLKIIDGNGENTRASVERALLSALLRGDDIEFNRLLDILEQRPHIALIPTYSESSKMTGENSISQPCSECCSRERNLV